MSGPGDEDRGAAQGPRRDAESPRPRSEAGADPRTADTTRWAGAVLPPRLVEEETGADEAARAGAAAEPAPVSTPTPLPDAEATVVAAPGSGADADADADAEATVVAAPGSRSDADANADAEATVVATPGEATAEPTARATIPPSSALHPMLLERVEPSLGRGERLRLDAAHWHVRLGRAEHNEIRLYTASASREHAEIRGDERGEWILTPAEGKTLLVDGDPVDEPIVLEVGMNLVMGGDHLRCVTEGLARPQMTAQTAAEGLDDAHGVSGFGGLGRTVWLALAIGALGVALLIFAWLAP